MVNSKREKGDTMSERVTQIVKASLCDNEQDGYDYRVVGSIDDSGFFAYVELRPASNPNAVWVADANANQYQVWEMDTADFMSPVDLTTNEHAREWFSGQGYELATTTLSLCCGGDCLWMTCEECEESDEPHDFATCSSCGADIDD